MRRRGLLALASEGIAHPIEIGADRKAPAFAFQILAQIGRHLPGGGLIMGFGDKPDRLGTPAKLIHGKQPEVAVELRDPGAKLILHMLVES